ncbi:hypothetical protein RB195_000253 [Necator americanus]|uniref:Uncharacterized protein n=1 Tax=Necator americanus TaxID=51031 RepID=A0ABR1D8S2_NECAM
MSSVVDNCIVESKRHEARCSCARSYARSDVVEMAVEIEVGPSRIETMGVRHIMVPYSRLLRRLHQAYFERTPCTLDD